MTHRGPFQPLLFCDSCDGLQSRLLFPGSDEAGVRGVFAGFAEGFEQHPGLFSTRSEA